MRKYLKRLGYTLLFLFLLMNFMVAVQAYHSTRFYNADLPKKHINEMSLSEKLSAVIFGVHVPKSKITDTLSVQHDGVSIKTEDGLTLQGWYAKCVPKDDTVVSPKGTVILFHGHGASRSGVVSEAEAFYNMGYNVLMIDFRAHGQSDGNVCTIGYYEVRDVKAAYDYIAQKGEKNIVLWGISLGASTIIKTIHDYDIKPAKIILEMPFGTLFDAVRGTMRLNHVPEEPAAVLLTFWGGVEHGFWAYGMQPQEYAKSIHCPVLLQHGADDIRVTEKETHAIYNSISSPKTLVEYANCGHESLYMHDPVRWVQAVTGFLEKP